MKVINDFRPHLLLAEDMEDIEYAADVAGEVCPNPEVTVQWGDADGEHARLLALFETSLKDSDDRLLGLIKKLIVRVDALEGVISKHGISA